MVRAKLIATLLLLIGVAFYVQAQSTMQDCTPRAAVPYAPACEMYDLDHDGDIDQDDFGLLQRQGNRPPLISGRILDPLTGEPIAGVTILAEPADTP